MDIGSARAGGVAATAVVGVGGGGGGVERQKDHSKIGPRVHTKRPTPCLFMYMPKDE
jgi:hypothetical protein